MPKRSARSGQSRRHHPTLHATGATADIGSDDIYTGTALVGEAFRKALDHAGAWVHERRPQ